MGPWWGHSNTYCMDWMWGHGGDMAILDCWDMVGTWQHWTVGTWWGHGNTGLWGTWQHWTVGTWWGHGNTGLWGHGGDMANTGLRGHGGEMATLDCGTMAIHVHAHALDTCTLDCGDMATQAVGTWQHMYWTVGTQNRYLFNCFLRFISYWNKLIKFCQNNNQIDSCL